MHGFAMKSLVVWLIYSIFSVSPAAAEIVESTIIDAPMSIVRTILEPAQSAAYLSPDVLNAEVEAENDCTIVHIEADGGPLGDITYSALRCPTPKGWREQLVSSTTIEEYAYNVSLEPITNVQTRVTIRSHIRLRASVPNKLIDRGVRRSVRKTLERLSGRALNKYGRYGQ